MLFGADFGFQNVIMERDSLSAIKKLKEVKQDIYVIGNIIEAINKKIFEFLTVDFFHISRMVNVIAHKIAELGQAFPHSTVWKEEVPQQFEEFVEKDLRTMDVGE